MISTLMIITSTAMLAFPKQLRGNRIPAPHQVESIDAHKTAPKVEQQPEEESVPQLKGGYFMRCVFVSSNFLLTSITDIELCVFSFSFFTFLCGVFVCFLSFFVC